MNRYQKVNCANMNHGKSNPPINYCPSCGEKFKNSSANGVRCNLEIHAARRKDRNLFCTDCGKSLTSK